MSLNDQENNPEVRQEIHQSLTTVKKSLLRQSTQELDKDISDELAKRSCATITRELVQNTAQLTMTHKQAQGGQASSTANDLDVTEGDWAVKVWMPLLECITRDDQDLRLKWGESSDDCSKVTEGQIGFKVDVRVVHDNHGAQRSKRETDTGNGELHAPDKLVTQVLGGKDLSVPALQLANSYD
ncbi:hypothetical protein BDA99DRAFT_557051 [Phascolomyces articulosus]|uniref:Uncharacterized protein n=1 Tax=Phascolomyces articulosus TaxID=60185 RepID=A0AAD5KNG4_9FUNG|nr:hypothetical protein BDA99DRAFT_557051 [Phascolomyces articulosus]